MCFALVLCQSQVQPVTPLRGIQVQGKSAADQYLVFPDHYCSCQAFFYEVVGRSEAPYVSMLLLKSTLAASEAAFSFSIEKDSAFTMLKWHAPLPA